jgi:hypothetical protein
LRLALDFLNYYWNSLIVDYDFQKQVSLFSGVGNFLRAPLRQSFSLGVLMPWASYAVALVVIIAVPVFVALRRKSFEKRLVGGFVARLAKLGYERRPSEGLEEFASRISDPAVREKALRFAAVFEASYYRDREMTRAERANLKRLSSGLSLKK